MRPEASCLCLLLEVGLLRGGGFEIFACPFTRHKPDFRVLVVFLLVRERAYREILKWSFSVLNFSGGVFFGLCRSMSISGYIGRPTMPNKPT
jgi:hypothetical protein